ncbi:MAG TPA: TonB-dependent receptor [Caulobacteraceae bacterium]|nr:TonB-dependent receptor [Caulobacteraceae bacterium]
MRLTLTLLAAAALAAPGFCLADPAPADPGAGNAATPPTPVSAVVVDSTRLPTLLVDAPDVEVITRADIDAHQAVYAADILKLVPGLALTDDGGFGGVTSVRMRGASSDKTLVLIDGVPQNDPSDPNGAYDFANLDLSNIDRIEVLEGPQSSLWGSDAIGGVISMTTRELNGWQASGEGGSLHTFDGSAAFGQRTDQWAFGATVFGDRSDGVAKADGIGPRNPYWSWSAGAYGRYTPNDWISFDAHLRYEQSYAGVDGYDASTFVFGYTPQYATTQGWSGTARAVVQAPLGFTDTLSVGVYDLGRSDTYIGVPSSSSSYTALTQDYRFTAERGAPTDRWGLDFGAERQTTDASLSTGDKEGLGTTSGFVVVRFRPVEALILTASERYDAPDSYAASATGHASAVLKLPAGFQVEGAWGQGFKTPTISEIACDFCFPTGPSLGLKPEHAEGWDGALAWASADGAYTAKVTGYRLDVRDQIEFAADFPFRYVNIDNTRTNGVEVEASARLSPSLSLQGEYAYTDAVDLDAQTQVLRVPRNAGSVTLTWTQGRWQAGVTVRAEGDDADINPSTFSPQRRPGFVLGDLSGSYALTPKLQLTARIDDIANTRYEEALGYGEPRQMLFIGIRARQ